MLTELVKTTIRNHAERMVPEECCGLIVNTIGGPFAVEGLNMASDRREYFSLAPKSYLKAVSIGRPLACYHSHPNCEDDFSEGDKLESEKHKLAYVLYVAGLNDFKVYEPHGYKNPYIGREFKIGFSDCASLFTDYFRREKKLEFTHYPRDNNWYEETPQLFHANFAREGFLRLLEGPIETLKGLRRHDGLLFCLKNTEFPDHCAVYLGGGAMLHHLPKRLSTIESFSMPYMRRLAYTIRHKTLI